MKHVSKSAELTPTLFACVITEKFDRLTPRFVKPSRRSCSQT